MMIVVFLNNTKLQLNNNNNNNIIIIIIEMSIRLNSIWFIFNFILFCNFIIYFKKL